MNIELVSTGRLEKSQLDTLQDAIVAGMDSPHSARAYKRGISDFMDWYIAQGNPTMNKALINTYKSYLLDSGVGPHSVNQRLTSIRKLVREAADNQWMDAALAEGIAKVKAVKFAGTRAGNWITLRQANVLIRRPDISTLKGLRDRAILVTLLGSGLRRAELADLRFEHIRMLDNRWVIADIVGKRGKVRTIPINSAVKEAIDAWTIGAGISTGHVFRPMQKGNRLGGEKMRPRFVNTVVQTYAPELSAHDLRRTFAKLAYTGGAEITQIQVVLGHDSLETTRRYLGIELDLTNSPSDHISLSL